MYFRGAKILEAVIDSVLATGGDNIEQVILTGCSGMAGNCVFSKVLAEKIVKGLKW